MAIKISASGKDSGQKKIKIKKNTGLMPVVFYNTANGKKYRLYLAENLILGDIYSLLIELNIIVPPPKYFIWHFNLNGSSLDRSSTLKDNKVLEDSIVELYCKECREYSAKEISVHIIKGLGGADCTIAVPLDATIGDVIVGLINEGFLEVESPCSPIVLYCAGLNGDILPGVRYTNRNKTIEEYGWTNGQLLYACVECADGAPRLLNVCLPDSRLLEIEVEGYDKDGIMVFDLIEEKTGMSLSTNNSPGNRSFYYLFDERAKEMTLRQSMHLGCGNECFAFDDSEWAIAKYPLQLKKQIVEELK